MFQQDQSIFGGVMAQEIAKRGHFMDTESIQKTLTIFNFTTTYAILMKFATVCCIKRQFLLVGKHLKI